MKKIMITISDINGTRQYTLEELIRRFIPWIIVGIITVAALSIGGYKLFTSNHYQQQSSTNKELPISDIKYAIN